MSNNVTRLYDRLTPPERFHLLLDAAARDDEAEYGRLWRTTPRKTYTQADAAVTDVWEAAERATLKWSLVWTRACGLYLSVAAMLSGKLPKGVDRDEAELAQVRLTAELVGTYEGLARFCRRIDVEPATLLKAWLPPIWDDLTAHRAMLDFHCALLHEHPDLSWCKKTELWATVAEAGLCRMWPGLSEIAAELCTKVDELTAWLDKQ